MNEQDQRTDRRLRALELALDELQSRLNDLERRFEEEQDYQREQRERSE